jgi:imidazolonepropionase
MFDSLLKNIHIATMRDGYDIILNGAIATHGGKIVFVGKAEDAPQALAIRDGGMKWATPALVDCHTHLIYAGDRSADHQKRAQGISYEQIAQEGGGILSTVKETRAASEKTLYDLSRKRLDFLQAEGVLTVEIKSGYGLDLETERKMLRVATRLRDESGLRIQRTFLGAHALPPEFTDKDAYIDHICAVMLPGLHAENLIDAVDGFCEGIAFSTAQIEKIFTTAKNLGLPVKLHAEQLSNQHGAEMAARHQALSADHLEYLDESGVMEIAKAGTVAVLLPGAFHHLQEKRLPPIDLLRKYNVPMAVATDHNPGTSPGLSLLTSMRQACDLFGLTPEESFSGVTKNAAAALGMRHICGTLAVGKAADILLWDITHPEDLSRMPPVPSRV